MKHLASVTPNVWLSHPHANEHPLISVIIPVTRAEKFIHGLLEDLCSQTCLDQMELIFVDNASSQSELKSILDYAKRYENIHIFRHAQFVPLGFALQHAAEFARGELISVALPHYRHHANHYEKLLAHLNKTTDIVYADLAVTDFHAQKNNRTYENASLLGYVRYLSKYTIESIAEMFDVPPQFLIRRSFLMQTGGFLPDLDELSLYGNWINWIIQKAQTKHLNEILGLYLLSGKKKYQAIEERRYLSLLFPDVPLAPFEEELEKNEEGTFKRPTNRFVLDMSEMYFVTPPKESWHPIEARPFISVITTLDANIKDDDDYSALQNLITQLMQQTYPYWELILVQCDPEKPHLENFIQNLDIPERDSIRAFQAEFDVMSTSSARNLALRLAKGTLIVHASPMVSLSEQYLASCVLHMQNQQTGIGFFPYSVNQQHYLPDFEANMLFREPNIPIETWVYRRECLHYFGLFDESLKHYDQWEWLLRLSKKTNFQLFEQHHIVLPETEKERIYRFVGKSPEKIDACIHEFQSLMARYPKDDPIKVRVEREQYVRRLLLHKPDDMFQTWNERHGLREIHAQIFAERMLTQWTHEPVLHLVFLVYSQAELTLLISSLETIQCQLYKKYVVTILSPLATPSHVPILLDIPDLQWVELYPQDNLPELLGRVVEFVPSDWVSVIEPGTRFEPHTLITLGNYINAYPEWRVIYTDEDVIHAKTKELTDPQFKPDFNLDYLRSMSYIGRFVVFKTEQVQKTPHAFRYFEIFNYDMALQVLDLSGEKAFGHIADILAHLPFESERSFDEGRGQLALQDHLERNRIAAKVDVGFVKNTYFVEYLHPSQPFVSIIIPNKNKLSYLEPCITSLFEKTDYTHYEVIIIDNQSDEPEVFAFYQECEEKYGSQLRILPYDHPFNFAAICNFGVKNAKGEYVLLLNNDTQFLQKSWLSRMMMHAQRPEVGIVGAKLLYPELGYVQHGGVILGMLGTADHACHVGQTITDPLYMNRGVVVQNFSSVTAACMVVRKSVYEQVNGMDEKFAVLFNDSDFCIRVGEAGHKITYTPFAMVVHHESISRKKTEEDSQKAAAILARDEKERTAFINQWLPKLANDPAYNPNLSLHMSFRVEPFALLNWDPYLVDRPRIVGVPLSGGCGQYRVISPFERLGAAGLAECEYLSTSKGVRALLPIELARLNPDSIMLHAALDPAQQNALKRFKESVPDVFRLFALDDLVSAIPEKSSAYRGFKRIFGEATSLLRKSLSYCDRMIVSTEPIKQLAEGMIEDIRVVPNCLERDRWVGLETKRRIGKKPRVGWAGAQQHQGDLEIIIEVVKATAHEVDWIFMGMTIPELKPFVKEEYHFVPYVDYPKKLASLNLDLAIAPLEVNEFNEAKSNLRLLEYGVMGWPIICTDIYPYQQAGAPVKRVPNQAQAWIDAIRERVHDLDAAEKEGLRVQKWVLDHFIIEDHLAEWLEAMLSPAKWNEWKYKLNLVPQQSSRRQGISHANPAELLANILGNIKK